MITDKITVFGEKQEAMSICDLLNKCTIQTDVVPTPVELYLWEGAQKADNSGKAAIQVVPYDMRGDFPQGAGIVTYSDVDNSADISAVNPQKRETSLCFEILCGVFMSRVFIPDTSEYTQRQVLACASVLYAMGVPMKKVVSLINESLK